MKKLYSIIFLLAISLQINAQNGKNVLFIAIDDLKPLLNCYGEGNAITPNIDLLASRGTVFTNTQCQWSVCGPSRASFLTGKTPDVTGVRNLTTKLRDITPDIVTLPQFFKNSNYTTAAAGKIFDPRNVDDGHDEISWSIPYIDPNKYDYPAEYGDFVGGNSYRVLDNTATEKGPEGVDFDGYADGQICLDALGKIDAFAENSTPFFMAVGFKKPHIPFVAPAKYWDLYNRDELEIAEFQEEAEGSPSYTYYKPEPISDKYVDIPSYYSEDNWSNQVLETSKQKELLHGYYACVSYADDLIGKLMAKLEEKGLAENTVIVLFGDHGYHLGDHNQWGKHTNFENATRVPLIIFNPGQEASVYNKPVDLFDMFPTLAALTGLPAPADLQGTNLKPVLDGSDENVKEVAVSEFRTGGHAGYSFRSETYRYSIWLDSGDDRADHIDWDANKIVDEELYDYVNDPLETVNLANQSEYISAKAEMKVFAENWWNKQRRYMENPLGIDELNSILEDTVVFPNPTNGKISISGKKVISAQLYSIKGEFIENLKAKNNTVDLTGFSSGYYILKTRTKTEQITHKIFVK